MIKAIDVWVNPFTPELIKKINDDPEIHAAQVWWHMEDRYVGYPVKQMLRLMDESAVEKVLVPSFQMYSFRRKTAMLDYNIEEIAALCAQKPDRFFGMYGINPFKRMQGVKELERSVKEFGFKGAHLHTYGFGLPIDAPDYYPYYAKCSELGIPVIMQVGHSAEALPSECGRPIRLDNIALYFSELNIIGTHTGWPWTEELIAMAWKHPNVYAGTTGHAPQYWDKSLVDFANTRGRGKIMWGTDFPVVMHKEGREQIEKLGLRDKALSALLYDTAAKVFKL